LAFIPRTDDEGRAEDTDDWARDPRSLRPWARDKDILVDHLPVRLRLAIAYGAGNTQRNNALRVEMFGGGDDERVFMYTDVAFSADIARSAGQPARRRSAASRGARALTGRCCAGARK